MGITNRQLFFLNFILIIPFTAGVIPKFMAESFKTGSWIFIIGTTIIYCLAAGLISYLGYLFRNMTLFEYSQLLLGKFGAYFISILYMINFFIFYVFLIRSVSEIIKSDIMPSTPLWATMLVMIIISGYAAAKGLTNIGRITELIGIIVLLSGLIINLLMFCNGDILNIRPLLNFSEPQIYISSFPITLYLYSGFEIMTIIPFTERNSKKVITASILSILLLGFYYIMIIEACFMILGVEDTLNYNYPLLVAIRRLDIAIFQFLKRIDLIFIMIWFFSVFSSSVMLLYGTTEYARKMLSKPNNNKILVTLCFIAFIACLIPQSDADTNQFVMYYCYYVSGIVIFIIPLTLLIITKVKNHEKKLQGM